MLNTVKIRQKIKKSNSFPYSQIRGVYYSSKKIEIPTLPIVKLFYKTMLNLALAIKSIFSGFWHFFVIKPVFQSMTKKTGHSLVIESKTPQVWNNPEIIIGDRVRLSGHTSFFGCPFLEKKSILIIGDDSYVGYSTTIAIGQKVQIGNGVKIAANCFIAGYYGHPTNPEDRKLNLSEKSIEEIVIGDNVWIGTNSKIMKNIKIGKNSIISAGSVVIKDVPENVIVAGNPAKIVKRIEL